MIIAVLPDGYALNRLVEHVFSNTTTDQQLLLAIITLLGVLAAFIQSRTNGTKLDKASDAVSRVETNTNGALDKLQEHNKYLAENMATPEELAARKVKTGGA